MLTDKLLRDSEPLLRQKIRDYYGYTRAFEPNTFGDELLQAGRIALFQILSGYHIDPRHIFEDNELKRTFFLLMKEELDEGGKELISTFSLDDVVTQYPHAHENPSGMLVVPPT